MTRWCVDKVGPGVAHFVFRGPTLRIPRIFGMHDASIVSVL